MLNIRQYNIKKLNISIIISTLLLTIIGIVMIKIVDPSLVSGQIIGMIIGLIVCTIVALADYHMICGFAVFAYAIAIVLLLLVQVPGVGVEIYEAVRWIKIGPVQLQPSELCKVIMIIVLAQFFTLARDMINNWKILLLFMAVVAFPCILVFIQPDLSSCLVFIFFSFMMLYSAGISYKILVPFLLISVPVAVIGIWYVCQPYQGILADYQQGRIVGLLHPDKYPDIMFQQNKSVTMMSNGKLYGIFNGGSTENLTCVKLPIVESDFIFTAVGETLGFIGAGLVIALEMFLILKCLSTARKAKDYTGKLICIGVSAMFMFQVFANIGVVTRILPNTGLPLPFISSGSSALLSYFTAIGLVINIGLQGKTTIRG